MKKIYLLALSATLGILLAGCSSGGNEVDAPAGDPPQPKAMSSEGGAAGQTQQQGVEVK